MVGLGLVIFRVRVGVMVGVELLFEVRVTFVFRVWGQYYR